MIDRRSSSLPDSPIPTVMARPSDRSACGFYRVLQPLRLLHAQGKINLVMHEQPDGTFAIGPGKFDVLILQKVGGALEPGDKDAADLLADLKRPDIGRKVVYEIDDDLFRVTKENPVIHPSKFPGFIERTKQLMRACRLVTTTTAYAAANLRRIHPEVRVVPNGIDLGVWRDGYEEPDNGDQVRIVWAASPNHVEDARLLIGPFRQIAREFPRVKLITAGGFFPSLVDCGARVEHAGELLDVPDKMANWPRFARSLRADIWLAPLVDSRFARSKSPLKAIEGTAAGAAVIASDVEPYRVGPDGSPWVVPPWGLVRNTREWVIALRNLILHARFRRELAAQALDVVRKHYTAQASADRWLAVIHEVAGISSHAAKEGDLP